MIDHKLHDRILEKRSKLDSIRPLDPGALGRLRQSLIVDMTYNSNSIEGNTLSLSETKLVLEEGITIGGKTLIEHLEATNHKNAMERIEGLVGREGIQEIDVLELHALILDRIDPMNAGFYRRQRVMISGSRHIPPKPSMVPELMKGLIRSLNQMSGTIIECAAQIHMTFVDIHPFIDGNGRCARLLLNLYLMRNGYPPIIIRKVERKQYINYIEKWRKGDKGPFINYIARTVERGLYLFLEIFSPDIGEYISLAEASAQSRYSQEYLSLLARKGKIGAIKRGRNWEITIEELKNYEKEHEI